MTLQISCNRYKCHDNHYKCHDNHYKCHDNNYKCHDNHNKQQHRSIFQEMISMDTLIVQIMNQAQKLVSADRWRNIIFRNTKVPHYCTTRIVVIIVYYYSCFQGVSLPCWLKNKSAVRQVRPKYCFSKKKQSQWWV